MTFEMVAVLLILLLAFALMVSGRMRMDLVAIFVMAVLAISGIISPQQALSGFSNPAVITVWAIFILSGGLANSGVSNIISHRMLLISGNSEVRLVIGIMVSAAMLSAFLNNVGIAALLLPVAMDVSRRTKTPPSRLLMPLAFGALLGGLMTMIGTPPNILVSDALIERGLAPFGLLDFAPVGIIITFLGIGYMTLVGRHLLPSVDIAQGQRSANGVDLNTIYNATKAFSVLRIPFNSPLAGNKLVESRLGAALGLNVLAIIRNDETLLAPQPEAILQREDQLLVGGNLENLEELRNNLHLNLEQGEVNIANLTSDNIHMIELTVSSQADWIGKTLLEIRFRHRYGVIVLAIRRDTIARRSHVENFPLQEQDILLVQGLLEDSARLARLKEFEKVKAIKAADLANIYHLQERLVLLSVPHGSVLVGRTLAESRLGDAYGLGVLGIMRGEETILGPGADQILRAGDSLFVKGSPNDLAALSALSQLEVEPEFEPVLDAFENEDIGFAEVALSPHTTLSGKTMRELRFREKYELNILAIFREGKVIRSDLRDLALRFGDAMLLYGPRKKINLLSDEPNFLLLSESAQPTEIAKRAPIAVLILLGVLIPVFLGLIPIAIAAVLGAAVMVLSGCLTMEDAYRSIEWPAVFLIAGMLPLGIALEETGTASFLADQMVRSIGSLGPIGIISGLFLMTTLTSQIMPNAAVAVLMIPIALNLAEELSLSPSMLLMVVAISASASFLSPVAHPANSLVMGPGGYRFTDFLKVGIPLTLIVWVVVILILPLFWPS
jgi:di/tricarboxylate transporter